MVPPETRQPSDGLCVDEHHGLHCEQRVVLAIENLRFTEVLIRQFRSPEQRNVLILSTTGEGNYVLDSKDLTTFVNPAAVRRLGWSFDKLLG